jgi:hypothetical protein
VLHRHDGDSGDEKQQDGSKKRAHWHRL